MSRLPAGHVPWLLRHRCRPAIFPPHQGRPLGACETPWPRTRASEQRRIQPPPLPGLRIGGRPIVAPDRRGAAREIRIAICHCQRLPVHPPHGHQLMAHKGVTVTLTPQHHQPFILAADNRSAHTVLVHTFLTRALSVAFLLSIHHLRRFAHLNRQHSKSSSL
ncbi:hypothetical protein BCV69DRAFT_158341 [Microstroma glucosiphilum]|uniref:Uncharacterized protein n=1 Tax=Pseudomicrostroma glucosiphilum TaxID=1684307 RepID=A0A316UBQ2_9BASI|nr:hypothetical protein BCV69DRAFT_158341 [Pseudomicrostroma glucosiphilum]PWN21881.1 hypothetical protein BCV69DRAFT_158341 [Pseudomicrostroma glucosiphilum]